MRIPLLTAAVLLAAVTAFAHGPAQPPLKSPAAAALRKGDLETALTLFESEIKASPDEPRLKQHYAELKTHLRREKMFAAEQNPEMKTRIGRQLRRFYYKYGMFGKAEQTDRAVYAADASEANAVSLGVTLLNTGKNQEAAELFRKVNLDKAKPGVVLCAALAEARTGSKGNSVKLLSRFSVEKMDANSLQLYARCAALNGDAAGTAAAVRRILEQTKAKQHPSLKKHLFSTPDFRNVAEQESFKAALNTESKVKDNCDTCPKRGTAECEDNQKH